MLEFLVIGCAFVLGIYIRESVSRILQDSLKRNQFLKEEVLLLRTELRAVHIAQQTRDVDQSPLNQARRTLLTEKEWSDWINRCHAHNEEVVEEQYGKVRSRLPKLPT